MHAVPRRNSRFEFQFDILQMSASMTISRDSLWNAARMMLHVVSDWEKSGRKTMDFRRGMTVLSLIVFMALGAAPASRAQAAGTSSEVQGVDSGNYNIQQTIEFGYRYTGINGNIDTYDTFINLGSGVRLFDYTLDMRSLNHQGIFFDDLNFSNFGYGGDPNDVSRLHIDKNKWYDFHLLFRRDKNFWDYNLFANPLNPAGLNPAGSPTTGCIVSGPTTANPGLPGYCSNPSIAAVNSAHGMDLVRRMQDYDLTLFRSRAYDSGLVFRTTATKAPVSLQRILEPCRISLNFTATRQTLIAQEWISVCCRARQSRTTNSSHISNRTTS